MKKWPMLLAFALLCSSSFAATTLKTLSSARPGYYHAVGKYPVFSERTPVARLANQTLAAWARRTHQTFIRESEQTFKDLGKPTANYEQVFTCSIGFNDAPRLISVRFERMEYTGGAHPNTIALTFNFGLINGTAKRLTLGDLFTSGSDYRKKVNDLVMAQLKKNEAAAFVADGTMKNLNTEQLERFVIEPDGLRFILNRYEAGPYAAGDFEVKLNLRELGSDFKRQLLVGRGR